MPLNLDEAVLNSASANSKLAESAPENSYLDEKSMANLQMFTPRVGTHIYRAPEILNRGQMYNESIDLWSAGCCIYFMLVGKSPFRDNTK